MKMRSQPGELLSARSSSRCETFRCILRQQRIVLHDVQVNIGRSIRFDETLVRDPEAKIAAVEGRLIFRAEGGSVDRGDTGIEVGHSHVRQLPGHVREARLVAARVLMKNPRNGAVGMAGGL